MGPLCSAITVPYSLKSEPCSSLTVQLVCKFVYFYVKFLLILKSLIQDSHSDVKLSSVLQMMFERM